MNLKKAFFKDYYSGIDFRKSGNPGQKKRIEEYNANVFKHKNRRIFDFRPKQEDLNRLDLFDLELDGFHEFPLKTTYPGLLTGSGMVHETGFKEELMLGFFFDQTTGLPVLPGSSVKGALRGAFPGFSSKVDDVVSPALGKASDKQKAKAEFVAELFPSFKTLEKEELYKAVYQLELSIFEGVDFEKTIAVGKNKLEYTKMRNRCRFLDAVIIKPAENGKIVGVDALTPHNESPLRNPIPLPFLKVLPDVVFNFQFILKSIKTTLGDHIGSDLEKLFETILKELGMGAKTNVGYGQFVTANRTRRIVQRIAVGQIVEAQYVSGSQLKKGKLKVKVEGEKLFVEVDNRADGIKSKSKIKVKITEIDATGKITGLEFIGYTN